jgi:hypothetical protein
MFVPKGRSYVRRGFGKINHQVTDQLLEAGNSRCRRGKASGQESLKKFPPVKRFA